MRVQLGYLSQSVDLEDRVTYLATKSDMLDLVERALLSIGYSEKELADWFSKDEDELKSK